MDTEQHAAPTPWVSYQHMHSMSSVLLQKSRQNKVTPEKVLARLCSCCQSSDEVALSDRSMASGESSSVSLRPCILFCRMHTSTFRAAGTPFQLVSTEMTFPRHAGPTNSRNSPHPFLKNKWVQQASTGRLPLSNAPVAMVARARTPEYKGSAQGLARLHPMSQ